MVVLCGWVVYGVIYGQVYVSGRCLDDVGRFYVGG